ncbi:MAG TPA: Rid family hydrolase [Micromonosporaceae bacterium]|jgi:enamine deaminase RidA (YjgF/YER057c/UK114 family)|nr:Rid family hydrolase [Micromonosporaceae bacterium]
MTAQDPEVVRRGSGGPWEDAYGYARVVVAGSFAFVSGCTSTGPDGVIGVGDAAVQARTAFGIALGALADVGIAADRVVRTRMYVIRREDSEIVGRVHGELFGSIRPAATLVVVAGLLHPDHLVEVEVVALAS